MKRCKTAFTLVELLVVIAIIGVLIALLVPAVQKVRESSARTQCQNNMHQQIVAMHNYADAKKTLPPAYVSSGFQPGWGWGTLILPYLEQKPLYESLNVDSSVFGGGANPAPATPLTQTHLPIFRCPVDLGPKTNPFRLDHGMSNYRGVAGPTYFQYYSENLDMGGAMWQNSKLRLNKVFDGTSNTLAIGECMYDEQNAKWAALWVGMSGQRSGGIYISDVMWCLDPTSYTINGNGPQAFSSRHPGGTHFSFCDGSVRFLDMSRDPNIIRWLAGRDDGQVVPPNDY